MMDYNQDALQGWLMGLVFLFLYFVPAIVAYRRRHRNRHAILILNLFLAWSLLGWIGALVWAATDPR
jgi:hypothetical protein